MTITQQFLDKVIDNLPLGIIIIDNNNEVIRFNKTLLEYFQIDDVNESDANTKLFISALIKNTTLNSLFEQALNGNPVLKTHCEINFSKTWNVYNNLSGDKYFQVDIFPAIDEEDGFKCRVALLTDLTPLHKETMAIKENQLNLKTIINNTKYNIFSVDCNLRFIEFNNSFKEEFDRLYNGNLKVGDSAIAPPIPDYMIADWKHFYATALTGEKIVRDYEFGGEPYIITLNPIIDGNKVSGIAVFSENVKEKKQLLSELNESQLRHKFAMDVSNSGFWDWNLETNEVYFSDIWKSMLGYEVNEVENNYQGWEQLVHEEDLQLALNAINDHVKGLTTTYKVEKRLRTKSGDYKWVLAKGRIVEFTAEGKPKRFIGVHIDIDYIKQTELDLKKRNEQLREIAYITSHGVRKSLANILGLTKIIDVDKFQIPENRVLIGNLLKSADELNEETIKLQDSIKRLNINLTTRIETSKTVKNILVIDDDPVNNMITSKYLQKAGLQATVFSNPEEALTYLKTQKEEEPDLILLDINMPQMSGFEFLHLMEKNKFKTDVIMLTSSINVDDRKEALKFKTIIDFWPKPLNFEKILQINS